MSEEKKNYTIKQFCHAYGISRSFLYALWKRGKGPLRFYIGGSPRISKESADQWHGQLQNSILQDRVSHEQA